MHFIMPRFFVNCERWKWNNDLRIYVSTHGHVKDEHKKNIAAKINDSGYFVVPLNNRFYSIHRLVLMTWRPLPNDGTPMTVDHLDSNRRNNHLDNLEWVSQEENLRRASENLAKDKAANFESLPSLKSTNHIKEPLGPIVKWQELCEKFGYTNSSGSPYRYEGSIDEVRELWESGAVTIYKGQSYTKITPAMVRQAIAGQRNAELMLERFLKKSITRTGKYLGWTPWMRWSK
jgi:hypothetical protein